MVSPPPTYLANDGQKGRLASLDGLRFVAALMVVLFHFVATGRDAWGEAPDALFPVLHLIASYGWLGVELFFVISGFVICMSAWGRSLGDFFVSRVSRLYPAYWLAVIVTTVALRLFESPEPVPTIRAALLNLTMLQDAVRAPRVDSVYWTLWIELCFYLLFALVVWRGVTYRRVVTFCLLWTVASVFALYADNPVVNLFLNPRYSSYFIGGVAIYLMTRFGQNLLLWGIVGVSLLRAQYDITEQITAMGGFAGRELSWPVVAALITAFFLLVAAIGLGWLPTVRWRWLTFAGALTYPLYLTHKLGLMPIVAWRDSVDPWLLLGAVTAGTLVVAWLVHRFVERPLMPLLRRLLKKSFADLRAAAGAGSAAAAAAGAEPGGAASAPVRTSPADPNPGRAAAAAGPGTGERPVVTVSGRPAVARTMPDQGWPPRDRAQRPAAAGADRRRDL
ncbi:acyltransferase family protein [Polymorphospora rubra]|uniref:acyltransferase family protein n=1 Tax=Polymorphospora rubra TaxID=338584 RepID=UPI0033D73837